MPQRLIARVVILIVICLVLVVPLRAQQTTPTKDDILRQIATWQTFLQQIVTLLTAPPPECPVCPPARPFESCNADGTPNGADEDGDGVADETCRVAPPPPPPPVCTFTLAPTSVSAPAAGSSTLVTVTAAPTGCAPTTWTATSPADWVAVSSVSPTSASVTVQAHALGSPRATTLTIAGQPFPVNQAALEPPPPPPPPGSILSFTSLEITNIKPAGTGAYTANHRIYRAHPGLLYTIRVAVKGGAYPYTFALSNAPAGMAIDGRGVITWPTPEGPSASPRVTVRDALGGEVSATWTIAVSASPFRFVDAVNGNDANPGTEAAPWRTWARVYSGSSGSHIVYVRAGLYTVEGLPTQATDHALGEEYVLWDGVQRAPIWIAYPGDARPVFDFGYVGTGEPYNTGDSVPRFKINGPNLWIEGIRFTRCMTMCFQVNHGRQGGTTFWRNEFSTSGPGIDGGNSAQIMTVAAQGANALYTVIQDNLFEGVKHGSANSGIKLYTLTKPVIEDNLLRNFDPASEGIAIKAAISEYTVRGNVCVDVGHCIGGNMNLYSSADQTRGEIAFNTAIALRAGSMGEALHFNQNSACGETFIYRNTLIGRVIAFNVDGSDGLFHLVHNLIVNSDTGTPAGSRVTYSGVSAPSRIIHTDNLTGTPSSGLVDASGKLTGAARAEWLGLRGAEVVR